MYDRFSNIIKKPFVAVFFSLVLFSFTVGAWATEISKVMVNPAVVPLGAGAKVDVEIESFAEEVSDASLDLDLYRGDSFLGTQHKANLQINTVTSNGPGVTVVTFNLAPHDLSQTGNYRVVARLSGYEVVSYGDYDYYDPSPGPVPANGPTLFQSTKIAYFSVKGKAISLSTSELHLQAASGGFAEGVFRILSGEGPFSLVSERGGAFSDTRPNVGDTITYRYQIPASAKPGDVIQDRIIIRGADGVETSLSVTITVSGGENPQNPDHPGGEGDVEKAALTPPQKSVGGAIDTFCPTGAAESRLQQDCNLLTQAAADPDTAGEATRALAAITADQARIPVSAAHAVLGGQGRNVGIRLAALRGGATGVSVRGLALSIDGKSLPVGALVEALGADLRHDTGGSAGSDSIFDTGRLGVFLNGAISGGDKDRTENEAGFGFDVISLTLGMDYRFTQSTVAGIALGYSRNDSDLDDNGGYLDTTGYSLSLYGSWFNEAGYYLDAILAYGWSDYDQMRAIRYRLGDVYVDQEAHADYDGNQWSVALGGGRAWALKEWTITASGRLEYIHARVDAFDERMSRPDTNGGGWAVHVSEQEADSFTSQLGVDLSRAVSTDWGVLMPSVSLEWLHEFKDNPGGVSGHFLQDTSRTLFFLPTDEYDSDYFNLGLGVSAQFAGGISGFLRYRQLLGYQHLSAWTIHAGVRLEF